VNNALRSTYFLHFGPFPGLSRLIGHGALGDTLPTTVAVPLEVLTFPPLLISEPSRKVAEEFDSD
jgi:hypothetical protein